MDRHVRMGPSHGVDPLGRGDQVHELDSNGAPALEYLDRRGRRTTGRQHRVEDQANVDRRRVGQPVVVLHGPQGALVPEQAEVPDLGGRHQLEHCVDHAQPRPQDRYEPDAVGQLGCLRLLDRRAHRQGPDPSVRQCLVAQEPGQLANHLAELLWLGMDVTEHGQLVEDRRVLGNVQGRPC